VEIADALARHLGVKARFVQSNWPYLVPSLERGDFDVIMNGLEATPERRDRILLSRPYFIYGETLAVRKEDPFDSLDALKGKKVATLNQSFAFELLKLKAIEIVPHEGVQEPYIDLTEGRVDGVLLDHVIADRYGCNLEKVRCLEKDVARGTYVIGVRKTDPELKAAIDGALGAMISSGEMRRILERWKLWDARQDDLASPPAEEPLPTAPRTMDRQQILLFLEGAVLTLALSAGAFAIALPFGIFLAIVRNYFGTAGRALATGYIEIFRGTPVLLQLYLLYYGLAPVLKLSAFAAGVIGLGLNYAAYEAEVHRGALNAIPVGQTEAAASLGLTRWQTLRHVLLPQSIRHALPAVTNDFVALLKDSSIVGVITVVELTKRMTIAAVEIRSWLVPGIACALLYFLMSFPLARLSRRLEKRLKRDPDTRLA
jgi:polar amino acid transport system substrate-binding protein